MSSNEKTIEKEDNTEKFKAFQKRFFMLGIGFLIVASVLYVLLHSLAENPHIIIEFFIFGFAIFSVILIFIGLVMPKDTNWVSLVGSTVFLFCCLLVLIFYPDQEFQQRLNTISLVAIIGTLLFGVFDVFINAVFFPSKNAEIRQSVDFVSNRFAVDVLTVTLIIGTLFGTIAYLFFVPNNNLSLFFGGIDIKTVAIATAGLVTFFWAAKAAKNKSIELEEKKQDGKRRDKEIKMAEARDTAQLIAKASELLGSENDAQKNAGLAFLNTVASQKGGPLQKEAFDLLADFILSASDTTTANNPRMRAIIYVDDLLEESCAQFGINKVIVISASDGAEPNDAINNLNSLRIKNLYITYIGLAFGARAIHWATHSKFLHQFGFVNCDLDGARFNEPPEIIKNISAIGCHINNFKIFVISKDLLVQIKNFSTGKDSSRIIELKKYLPKNEECINYFLECDFSSSKNWKDIRSIIEAGQEKDRFDRCFYYAGHPPYGFGEEGDDALLTEISSERQFDELIDDPFLMKYSPPDDKKTSNE